MAMVGRTMPMDSAGRMDNNTDFGIDVFSTVGFEATGEVAECAKR